MQVEPQSREELLLQSLFGNPWILNEDGVPLGLEKGS